MITTLQNPLTLAAALSPVGLLANDEHRIEINNMQVGEVTQKLYTELTAIQTGAKPDLHGWVHVIK